MIVKETQENIKEKRQEKSKILKVKKRKKRSEIRIRRV